MEKGFSIESSTVNILNSAVRQSSPAGILRHSDLYRFQSDLYSGCLVHGLGNFSTLPVLHPLIGSYCLPAGQRMSSKDCKITEHFPASELSEIGDSMYQQLV